MKACEWKASLHSFILGFKSPSLQSGMFHMVLSSFKKNFVGVGVLTKTDFRFKTEKSHSCWLVCQTKWIQQNQITAPPHSLRPEQEKNINGVKNKFGHRQHFYENVLLGAGYYLQYKPSWNTSESSPVHSWRSWNCEHESTTNCSIIFNNCRTGSSCM